MMGAFEREAKNLGEMLDNGEIDDSQYDQEMRELETGMRECAQEAAQQAYDEEMGRW